MGLLYLTCILAHCICIRKLRLPGKSGCWFYK